MRSIDRVKRIGLFAVTALIAAALLGVACSSE